MKSKYGSGKYQDLISLATRPLMVQGIPPLPSIPKQKTQKISNSRVNPRQVKKNKSNSDLSHHLNQSLSDSASHMPAHLNN